MNAPKLIARATKTAAGWRPEILLVDASGKESLWGTASVATKAEAQVIAKRLATIAAEVGPIAPGEDGRT